MTKQYHITIIGRVQGVGFRYYTLSKAKAFEITGWVRNTIEGNVEIIAQGKNIDAFLETLKYGPGRIEKIHHELEKVETFDRFQVKH